MQSHTPPAFALLAETCQVPLITSCMIGWPSFLFFSKRDFLNFGRSWTCCNLNISLHITFLMILQMIFFFFCGSYYSHGVNPYSASFLWSRKKNPWGKTLGTNYFNYWMLWVGNVSWDLCSYFRENLFWVTAAEHLAICLSVCLRMLDHPRIDISLGTQMSWLSFLMTLSMLIVLQSFPEFVICLFFNFIFFLPRTLSILWVSCR